MPGSATGRTGSAAVSAAWSRGAPDIIGRPDGYVREAPYRGAPVGKRYGCFFTGRGDRRPVWVY